MIAAMFSSTMSAVSSHYNVCANVLTIDIYQRLFRPARRSANSCWSEES